MIRDRTNSSVIKRLELSWVTIYPLNTFNIINDNLMLLTIITAKMTETQYYYTPGN